MDRIALVSDIHGNIPALEATLQDIRRRDVQRVLCLGDLVGKGPHSGEAVDICREECDMTLKGNWDDFIVSETDNPTVLWHQQRLGRERLDYLGNLPHTTEFYMSGRKVRLFHASQKGVHHRVYMNDPADKLLKMFSNTDFTGKAFNPDVVGYGDIHSAYLTSLQGRTLFNVGSVGNPLDLTQASYAILEGKYGGRIDDVFSIYLIRVPYDIELAIKQARDEEMPDLEPYENELRTARYRGAAPSVQEHYRNPNATRG
jgi:protein phosphatase